MARTEQPFVPVLLGTDIGAYGMARSFESAFGVSSLSYGTFPLTPTAYSRFVEVHTDPDLMDPDRFVEVLNAGVSRLHGKRGLIISCGDEYTILLARVKERLDPAYDFVCPEPDVADRLNNKETFYQLCEQIGLPYPKTVVISDEHVPSELPFGFPVACKPSDAPNYRAHPFEGQRKAFICSTREHLERVCHLAYEAGYEGDMIIQDFIPGDDTNVRVVNGYVRRDGTVALLALGHPILEDYSPVGIGNYSAILSYSDDGIYDMVEEFLSHTEWHGFVNFDMKFDSRDGRYKLFELNPRQGRSSYYVTLAGYNLATYIVDDLYGGCKLEPVRATNEVLWVGIPKRLVGKYVAPGPDRDRALELIREGKVGTTLLGAGEHDIRRAYNMAKLWVHYGLDYRRYFGARDLD